MTEYFVRQFDGGPTACDGRNCACATGATAVAFATGGAKTPSSDEFRTKSGVSCVPGKNSPSGGLYISDIERTCAAYGVSIDFNRRAGKLVRRTAAQEKALLEAGYGMHCLGDYDQIPAAIDEQPGFDDDHSTWVHDYRASDDTVCWHDPLGTKPRRVKWAVVIKYHHKPGSEVRGLAGFVRIAATPAPPDTGTEDPMPDIFSAPGLTSVTFPKGTPLLDAPAGKTVATVADATRRYDVMGQDAATPTHLLVDDRSVPSAPLRWAKASSARDPRSIPDGFFNQGVDAAADAALTAKRS